MKLSYPEGIVVNILMDAATQICPFLRISSLLSFRGLECSLWFMLLDFGRVVCVAHRCGTHENFELHMSLGVTIRAISRSLRSSGGHRTCMMTLCLWRSSR